MTEKMEYPPRVDGGTDTPEEIARCLSCTRPRCVNCLSTLPGRKRKPGEKHYRGGPNPMVLDGDKFLALYNERKSASTMGAALGVSRDLVQRRLEVLGINGPVYDRRPVSMEEFRSLPEAGSFFQFREG